MAFGIFSFMCSQFAFLFESSSRPPSNLANLKVTTLEATTKFEKL